MIAPIKLSTPLLPTATFPLFLHKELEVYLRFISCFQTYMASAVLSFPPLWERTLSKDTDFNLPFGYIMYFFQIPDFILLFLLFRTSNFFSLHLFSLIPQVIFILTISFSQQDVCLFFPLTFATILKTYSLIYFKFLGSSQLVWSPTNTCKHK